MRKTFLIVKQVDSFVQSVRPSLLEHAHDNCPIAETQATPAGENPILKLTSIHLIAVFYIPVYTLTTLAPIFEVAKVPLRAFAPPIQSNTMRETSLEGPFIHVLRLVPANQPMSLHDAVDIKLPFVKVACGPNVLSFRRVPALILGRGATTGHTQLSFVGRLARDHGSSTSGP